MLASEEGPTTLLQLGCVAEAVVVEVEVVVVETESSAVFCGTLSINRRLRVAPLVLAARNGQTLLHSLSCLTTLGLHLWRGYWKAGKRWQLEDNNAIFNCMI